MTAGIDLSDCELNNSKSYGQILMTFQEMLKMGHRTDDYIL